MHVKVVLLINNIGRQKVPKQKGGKLEFRMLDVPDKRGHYLPKMGFPILVSKNLISAAMFFEFLLTKSGFLKSDK